VSNSANDKTENPFKAFLQGANAEESSKDRERRLRRMDDSMVVIYALAPDPPEAVGTFLSPEKQSVYLDYRNLPWKQLAEDLQKQLGAIGVPQNIKAFVGNEAIDIKDLIDIDEQKDYDPIVQANQVITKMPYKDFRGGIINFRNPRSLRFTPRNLAHRTPPAAIFVGFRFNNFMQSTDYLSSITYQLFGTPDHLGVQPGHHQEVPVPDTIKAWIESACGVVLGETMDIYRVGIVYRAD